MNDEPFDAIVVGAGLAGLCCAGELILQGARPLLICETQEVGRNLRSTFVGGNRAFSQLATCHSAWGGGWWLSLTKRLNVPIRFYNEPWLALSIWAGGPGEVNIIPRVSTAKALTEVLAEFSPWPIDDVKDEFERLMAAGMEIPYQKLIAMDHVSLSEWLADQGASEVAAYLVLLMSAQLTMDTVESSRQRTSVFGAFALLRTYIGDEGGFPVLYPDNREGLCIPIAKAVEARHGEVWRDRKLAGILTDGGRAHGVVFEDGTEVRAPKIAIATGNSRVPDLFDPLPPELVEPLGESRSSQADFFTYTTLGRPVLGDFRAMTGILGADGANLGWIWPHHAIAPWTTNPDQQLLVAVAPTTTDELSDPAKVDRRHTELNELQEAYFPGFKDAIVAQETGSHRHLWYDQVSIAPRLPRTIGSVENLWFVGDGSEGIAGIGFEAAASAGILGARSILATSD